MWFDFSGIKATVIHPATEKHIKKYTDQETFVIQETSDLYQKVTKPYLEAHSFSVQV